MIVCPNCGRTVTDDTTQFCPSCGFSFTQQPNQPYASNLYGAQPYGYRGYPRKSVAIAFTLSFLIPGVGLLYTGKIPRGILYLIVTGCFVRHLVCVDREHRRELFLDQLNRLISDPEFIGVSLASIGVWAFGHVRHLPPDQ